MTRHVPLDSRHMPTCKPAIFGAVLSEVYQYSGCSTLDHLDYNLKPAIDYVCSSSLFKAQIGSTNVYSRMLLELGGGGEGCGKFPEKSITKVYGPTLLALEVVGVKFPEKALHVQRCMVHR